MNTQTETLTEGNLQTAETKVKVAALVKARRGSAKKIAMRSGRSAGHVSLVLSGKRNPSSRIRKAASEVLRIPQKDLAFPTDSAA